VTCGTGVTQLPHMSRVFLHLRQRKVRQRKVRQRKVRQRKVQ
jgi:hypothetical protein